MALRFLLIAALITFLICLFLASAIKVEGAEIPDNMWQGLMAEAVGEGEIGIYAVACVYRNRIEKDIPLGCVALNRKDLGQFCTKQGIKWEWLAKEIVQDVFYGDFEDITGGATHYENIEAFGVPYWAKSMQKVCKIGNHTFWR